MEESRVGLCDLCSSTRWVPLGLRMCLAYALAVALGNFHRVGWVHNEVKSENIRLLKKDKQRNGIDGRDGGRLRTASAVWL